MDPLQEQIAQEIYRGFAVPSIQAADWHDRYKWMNRAAGAIAGAARVMAHLLEVERSAVAEELCSMVLKLAGEQFPLPKLWLKRSEFTTEQEGRKRLEDGLPERVAKCLLALDFVAPEVLS